ncbi:MAG TPA: hypothetical protein VFL86_17660, partial [Burkholderiaceae bacterium]|nr:hypothetical protein [Burkholderiaceae bacterium]
VGTANCRYLPGGTRPDIYTAPGLVGLLESGFEAARMGWRGTPRQQSLLRDYVMAHIAENLCTPTLSRNGLRLRAVHCARHQ